MNQQRNIVKVLAVVQTPPPFHGQAIMNEVFVTGSYQKIKVETVRMQFSDSLESIGKVKLGKIFELLRLLICIMLARLRFGRAILYYPPASPRLVPVLRDIMILFAIRWMFEATIFHFHAGGLGTFLQSLPRPLRLLSRLAYSDAEIGIALGNFARQDGELLKCRRVEVIPYGIADTFVPLTSIEKPDLPPTILFVGMVCREKGVEVLLEALSILKARHRPYRCLIAGRPASNDEMDFLTKKARQLGVADSVDFCGLIIGETKRARYTECDIFCFPTFYSAEALPVVILEAMMFAKPVVSSKWRGVAEQVVAGETGFLVEPKDSVGTADRLQALLENADLREQMGTAGRRRFQTHFTIERFRSRMENILSVDFNC